MWNGNLEFLPGELRKLADAIKSDYTNAKGGDLKMSDEQAEVADTLGKLARRQRDNFQSVQDLFTHTMEKL